MNLVKWLIWLGIGFIALAAVLALLLKMGLPIGKLPGDIYASTGKNRFYFPLMTSLIISLVLSILINLLIWLFKK